MTELELKKILGQEIEIPDQVEERIRQACAQARPAPRTVQRSRRPLRTALVAAAAVAVLTISAAAAYTIMRGEVPADIGTALEGFFGSESRSSVESTTVYDENGKVVLDLPNKEQVPVDEEQAEALVGSYLPDTGYVWQIGEYTVTVESYLLDENTGTAKIYYSLYRPGGVEGIFVYPEDGSLDWDGSGIIPLDFYALVDGEWKIMAGGKGIYADQSASAEDKLCVIAALALPGSWSAENDLRIEFRDLRRNQGSDLDVSLVATMELPGLESLPAVTVTDQETGEPVAVFSAIGMKVWAEHSRIDDIVLTYADGSEYVVEDKAAYIENYDYALWSASQRSEVLDEELSAFVGDELLPAPEPENWTLHLCFNRLVDPEQVVAVTVNGTTYAIS